MRRTTAMLITLVLSGAIPAQATKARPLPSADEVLQRIFAHADKEQKGEYAFNQLYGYTRTRVTEYRNSKGELKKREEKKSEHQPVPLPVESDTAGHASTEERGGDNASNDGHGRRYERKDFAINGELLSRFEFAVTGHEVIKGRPALVITFQPADRRLPEHGLKDRFINRTAGMVWVDEAEDVVVRAQFFLTEVVHIAGGLLGAVHSFNCDVHRERTDEGLWFTRAMRWQLDARKLFVREIVEHVDERANFQKTPPTQRESAPAATARE